MSGYQELKDDLSSAQDARTQNGMKKRKLLTQERVRELFDYDPESGIVTRRIFVNYNRGRVGDIVGYKSGTSPYLYVRIDKKCFLLHRVIWLWVKGYWPENDVDHINRNPQDNRWANLRVVSKTCGMINTKVRNDNNTKVRGVFWDTVNKLWRSRITYKHKTTYIGGFKSFTEAVAHRLAAEQVLEWEVCNVCSSAYQYMQKYLNGEIDDKTSD